MTVLDFVNLARRGWRVLVVAMLVGLLGGTAYFFLMPKEYVARATGFIAAVGESAVAGSDEATARAASYVPLITSGAVRDAVADVSDVDAISLKGRLTARVVPGSTLIEVSGTAADPDAAVALASGALEGLTIVINEIESATNAGTRASITVVPLDDAVRPSAPASPDLRYALAVGAAGGLVVGIILLLLRRMLDVKVRANSDLNELVKAGLLGQVPKIDRKSGDVQVLAKESFRHIRTGLRFASVDGEVRTIVITSANQGEGKSFVASSLARVIAEAGERTIIVDGDLRRPCVADNFGLDGTVGLSEVLSGQVDVADVVHRTDNPNLYVLTAGGVPPNPSEMLGSASLSKLIAQLREDFVVIMDAPPLLPVTDAALLSAVSDGVLLVAATGRTRKTELVAARSNLQQAHARVLGVVLNFVRLSDSHGGYGYYRQNRSYYLRPEGKKTKPKKSKSSGESKSSRSSRGTPMSDAAATNTRAANRSQS